MRVLRPYSFSHCRNMSKSNLNEAGWLVPREKNMPVITGDAIKYICIKPYVSSVPEKGHKETEQCNHIACFPRQLLRRITITCI